MERSAQDRGQVSADFDSMAHARAAMTKLERAGVDGGSITLAGAAARALRQAPDIPERDAGAARSWLRLSVGGAATGAVLGALAGALIGYLLFGFEDRGFLITTLGMAVVGLAIGGLVTPIASLPLTPQYDRTFQESIPGQVRVTVHSDDRDTLRRVAEVLADAEGAIHGRLPSSRAPQREPQ